MTRVDHSINVFPLADERQSPHGSAVAVAVLVMLALIFAAISVAAFLVAT